MKLEANTLITRKTFIDYYWFNLTKIRQYRVFVPLFLAIYSILFAIVLVFALSGGGTTMLILSGILFICVLFLYLLQVVQPIKTYRAIERRLSSPQKYVFENEQFSVHAQDPLSQGDSTNQYEVLVKAYETDDYFFLYIAPNQAYIIGKQDITGGSPEELRSKLQDKLGKLFLEKHR